MADTSEDRIAELERLVKHQADQLATHAQNLEAHGRTVADTATALRSEMADTKTDVRGRLAEALDKLKPAS